MTINRNIIDFQEYAQRREFIKEIFCVLSLTYNNVGKKKQKETTTNKQCRPSVLYIGWKKATCNVKCVTHQKLESDLSQNLRIFYFLDSQRNCFDIELVFMRGGSHLRQTLSILFNICNILDIAKLCTKLPM